jgi:hypothetical protein
MDSNQDFLDRLEKKVHQQLRAQRVGYLLGAGSSYLNGAGYPLTAQLWERIKDGIPEPQKVEVQRKLDEGAEGVEKALDLLDQGGVNETPHRFLVTESIASHFLSLNPPLAAHVEFVRRLAARQEPFISVFTLNYDPLVERAAEEGEVILVDGFCGFENAYFSSSLFQHYVGLMRRSFRGKYFQPVNGVVQLFKLHGSLGWFESQQFGIRRRSFNVKKTDENRRLMIPPQRRKANDTMTPPYATLWSEFRGQLSHGPRLMNRLVCIGYGMLDEHVNAAIENGLARNDFTLLIFSLDLIDTAFDRWSKHKNAIIVTAKRCSLYGEIGKGHSGLWDFQNLCKEI